MLTRGDNGTLLFVAGVNMPDGYMDPILSPACTVRSTPGNTNIVFRSTDAGASWTFATLLDGMKSADPATYPQYDNGIDRQELYVDPYNGRAYVIGVANKHLNAFANTNGFWKSDPPYTSWNRLSLPSIDFTQNNTVAAPVLMTSLSNGRLVVLHCLGYNTTQFPTIHWQDPSGSWRKSFVNDSMANAYCKNLGPSSMPDDWNIRIPALGLARVQASYNHPIYGDVDVVAVAYPSVVGTHQVYHVVNVFLPRTGMLAHSELRTTIDSHWTNPLFGNIEYGQVVEGASIEPDFWDSSPNAFFSKASVFYWIESFKDYTSLFEPVTKMRAKYIVLNGVDWESSPTVMSRQPWVHHIPSSSCEPSVCPSDSGPAYGGSYFKGGFRYKGTFLPGSANFYPTWPQTSNVPTGNTVNHSFFNEIKVYQ